MPAAQNMSDPSRFLGSCTAAILVAATQPEQLPCASAGAQLVRWIPPLPARFSPKDASLPWWSWPKSLGLGTQHASGESLGADSVTRL